MPGSKIDLVAFAILAVTVLAIIYHPSISKVIASLGAAYTGAVLAA
jgi:hypothetical protein